MNDMMQFAEIRKGSLELRTRYIEKPWGRTVLPSAFGGTQGRRIGEISFEHHLAEDLPLLVKYIFTSEKLSVQVHPDDEQARARGFDRGKTECWYILDAEDGASVGLGLTEPLSADDIRAAALDGSIEQLMDWKPVSPGDFIFVPAGTIHAIGAGISLLEFQQNADVTYRLYDYGRPRELHLDDGVAISGAAFDADRHFRPAGGPMNTVLVNGDSFSLVRATSGEGMPAQIAGRRRWVMPLEGTVTADGMTVSPGGCLLAERGTQVSMSPSAVVLVGAEGRL